MKKTTRPTTEEENYGRERYEQGYADGYTQAFWDINKIRLKKEKSSFRRFGKFWDRMDDELSNNRK